MRNGIKVELSKVDWEVLLRLLKSLDDGRNDDWLAEVSSRLARLIEAKLKYHYKDNPE